MENLPNPAPETGDRAYRFDFHGNGGDLFLLWLKNSVLILLTFGIYAAWAKAGLYRFFFSNIEVGGVRLRFTGTGKEILKGLLIVVGFVITYSLIDLAVTKFIGQEIIPFILYRAIVVLGFVYLSQIAIFSSTRYRLGRTQLREIRFVLQGSALEFAKEAFGRALLILLTFGVYFPFYSHWKTQRILGQIHYGTFRFGFDAPRGEYVRRAYVGFLGTVFTLGIYWFFFYPKWIAFKRRHTLAGQNRFECTFTSGEYLTLAVTNFLLTVLTLGFGGAWAMTRKLKFFASRTRLIGPSRLEDAQQITRSGAGATGESLADALDVDAGLDLGL